MRGRASNARLRALVTAQAREVARSVHWSAGVPRGNVGAKLCAYVADCIPYREDGALQSVRRPAVLVLGGLSGDCKSTAIFIGGLAAAAGCRAVLRFVQYPDGPTWYSHVYAVVDGVACDPLQGYAVEAAYLRCVDEPVNL